MGNTEISNLLYRESLERERQNRLLEKNKKDYELADKLRQELYDSLGVESYYLADLKYRKIKDDQCISILTKYIPLFENIGISLDLIQQQFYRKGDKECSDFLESWYDELKKAHRLTAYAENILDNAFAKIQDRDKISFYLDLIQEENQFPFVMEMLGRWKTAQAKPIIIHRLEKDNIKTSAIRALGYYQDKETIPLLEKHLLSEYVGVRKEAEKVINRLNNIKE